MLQPLLHGIILAFGLILPLGPQNVFLLSQGIAQPSWRMGMVAAFSAAICDSILIVLAVCGVSSLVIAFPMIRSTIALIGFVFLSYLGWCLWRKKEGSITTNSTEVSFVKQVAFTASVSLLNPHAILDSMGVIGTSALEYEGTAKLLFTCACLLVSWLWFFGLVFTGRFIRHYQPKTLSLTLNKFAAVIMWISALIMLRMVGLSN